VHVGTNSSVFFPRMVRWADQAEGVRAVPSSAANRVPMEVGLVRAPNYAGSLPWRPDTGRPHAGRCQPRREPVKP